jgi:hypothetical protein
VNSFQFTRSARLILATDREGAVLSEHPRDNIGLAIFDISAIVEI